MPVTIGVVLGISAMDFVVGKRETSHGRLTTGSLCLRREMTVKRLCLMWGLCVSVCRIGARCLHGDMPQNAREQALDGFRTGVGWVGADGMGQVHAR